MIHAKEVLETGDYVTDDGDVIAGDESIDTTGAISLDSYREDRTIRELELHEALTAAALLRQEQYDRTYDRLYDQIDNRPVETSHEDIDAEVRSRIGERPL